jgi:serine/threonine protein kinase
LDFERFVYEEVLPLVRSPHLQYYGFSSRDDTGWDWLFLEDAGTDSYSGVVHSHRQASAAWLAGLHASSLPSDLVSRIPERNLTYYLNVMLKAKSTVLSGFSNEALSKYCHILDLILLQFDVLESNWPELVALCDGVPSVLIHGDFKPGNIAVRTAGADLRIVPFDWAGAAWGLPLVDLAQSTSDAPELCASPDAGVYSSRMKSQWGKLANRSMSLLANVGTICRCILAIYWESMSLPFGWIDESVSNLRAYQRVLDRAIHEQELTV